MTCPTFEGKIRGHDFRIQFLIGIHRYIPGTNSLNNVFFLAIVLVTFGRSRSERVSCGASNRV